MDLEESLEQAEVMLNGNLPMKTARELLQELREDM